MKYQEMTDFQWKTVEKHLPEDTKIGRPRCDNRTTINGILYVAITGCRWQDVPKKYGTKSTLHLRYTEMVKSGTWKKILAVLTKMAHAAGKMNLGKISVDSTTVAAKKRRQRRLRRI